MCLKSFIALGRYKLIFGAQITLILAQNAFPCCIVVGFPIFIIIVEIVGSRFAYNGFEGTSWMENKSGNFCQNLLNNIYECFSCQSKFCMWYLWQFHAFACFEHLFQYLIDQKLKSCNRIFAILKMSYLFTQDCV